MIMHSDDFEIEENKLIKYHGTFEEHVIVPDGITVIGKTAFQSCRNIRRITLPESVEQIEESAFMDCCELEEINLPEKITRLEFGTFYNCKLRNIILPEHLTCIGNSALFDYYGEKIHIPESVTEIGPEALRGAARITEIEIPASVTSIGDRAFWQCQCLTRIHVSEQNQNYASRDGCLYNKEMTTLIWCTAGGKTFEVPDGVTRIEANAFLDRRNLEQITLPETIVSLGRYAFCGSSIREVYLPAGATDLHPEALRAIDYMQQVTVAEQNPKYASRDGVLYDKNVEVLLYCPPAKRELVFPDTVKEISIHAVGFSIYTESIVIPDALKVPNFTFSEYYCLKHVCYHGIQFTIIKNELDALFPFFRLIDEKNLSVEIRPVEKLPVVAELFLKNPQDEKLKAYLKENCTETFQSLIDMKKPESFKKLLDMEIFITEQNIDELIRYAIGRKCYDIQLMLTDYKYRHFDINPKDLSL